MEDPVARSSIADQASARAAVREGLSRVEAQQLDAAIEALQRARMPSVLTAAEVDPLRQAVDDLGTTKMRRLLRAPNCRQALALLVRLHRVGAAGGSQARLDHSQCARH
jgi:hypothetical protein